jgi:hypothetical protein
MMTSVLLSSFYHSCQRTIAVDEMMFKSRSRMNDNEYREQNAYHGVDSTKEVCQQRAFPNDLG